MSEMIALVDSDLVIYRCAASAEGEEEWVALSRVDELMERILAYTNATEYKAFLTSNHNFRKEIYSEYKANRTQPKPIHLQACRTHLVRDWQASESLGLEADDLLGIAQTENSVICSIDKDLRQVPGQHFNFVKCDWTEVDEYQAQFNFYRQFLIGDISDNIKGVQGIGAKKAEKELYGLDPDEMFNRVRELYNDDKRMLLNGRCLYIWRKEFDLWNPQQLTSQHDTQLEMVTRLFSITERNNGLPEPTKLNEDGFPIDGMSTEPTMEMVLNVP